MIYYELAKNKLPKSVYKKWKKNVKNHSYNIGLREVRHKGEDLIQVAFVWYKTPEGVAYWIEQDGLYLKSLC